MAEYHNPQNEPGTNFGNMVPMMILCVLIIVGMNYFFAPHKQSPANAPQQSQQQQQTPAQSAQSAQPNAAPAAMALPAAPVVQASTEAATVVENDLYRITFTNRGALVKSWILKKYMGADGKPLDLVQQQASAEFGYPLSLWSGDASLTQKLNGGLYQASTTGLLAAPSTLTFSYSDGDLVVEKKFHFETGSYKIGIESSVKRGGVYVTALPAWPAGFGDTNPGASTGKSPLGIGGSYYNRQTVDVHNGTKLLRMSADRKGEKVGNQHIVDGPIAWGGTVDQYFAAIFLPVTPRQSSLVQFRNSIQVTTQKNEKMPVEMLGSAAGELGAPVHTSLYVGPKVLDLLGTIHANGDDGQAGAGPDLQGSVNLGTFSFIAKPMFLALRWLNERVTFNWGWSIVLLTILFNLVLLPLRYRQMKSALQMQKIAPQMKNIQQRYNKYKFNDPKRLEMNEEIKNLQKEHGVNQFAGCLPSLVQFPFFFAYYAMLGNTIELRHASWLWIPDLSATDPRCVLPVLVGLAAFTLQRITPMGTISDDQRRMMNIMLPVIMLISFWNMAGGLNIYMVTTYVVNLSQQYVMNHTTLGREIREVQAKQAAKRRKK